MKKIKVLLQVVVFLAVVAAAIVFFLLPILSTTAPGGPKLSFGGSETCQLGDALEDFNAAGFYMGEDVQKYNFTGHSSQSNFAVFMDEGRSQSCGSAQLVNKGDGYRSGTECMVYSFSLRLADGGQMTCNGVETLGSTREAIRSGLGMPPLPSEKCDQYDYKKGGRTYTFLFNYDETGLCTSVSAFQHDPNLNFMSF